MTTITGTAGNDSIAGTTADDIISALGGNDTVFASSGNDTVTGGDGDDNLQGMAGNDAINGDAGNDTIIGGPGSDTVDGGLGDDTFVVRNDQFAGLDLSSGDQIIGGGGTDTIIFNGDFTYAFTAFDITTLAMSGIEIIRADLPVRLTFTQLSDLTSFSGSFDVTGSGTLDLTDGSFASGTLRLGSGNDIVTVAGTSGTGTRSLEGNGGDDQLTGGETSDILTGGDGNDTLNGGDGIDTLDGGAGNDNIYGGDGNDTILDSFGIDHLNGGAGDDIIQLDFGTGFAAGETVIGGSGVDAVWLSDSTSSSTWYDFSSLNISGVERLDADSINMIMTAAQAAQFESLQLSGLRLTTAGSVTAGANFQVGQFELSAFGNSVDLTAAVSGSRVTGGAGKDTVTGSSWNDTITGGSGNDVIHGGGSHDELTGGNGADWIDGGSGDDYLIVALGETISAGDHFSGGSDADTLRLENDPFGAGTPSDISIATVDADIETLSANYVRLTVEQAGAFQNISANGLYLANGGAVDFSDIAFHGNVYLSDFGNQVTASDLISNYGFNAYGGAGNDTIIASAAPVHNELSGGGGDDILHGGGGDDLLDGGTGADTMDGGAGQDSYFVDNAGDSVSEVGGGGYDDVWSTVSFSIGANIEELRLQGTDSINATGNALDNHLYGNSGNNLLDGGAGADVMSGGNGVDTYIVDSAGDTIIEDSGDDASRDGVQTQLASYNLPANVENLFGNSGVGQVLHGNDLGNVIIAVQAIEKDDQLYGGAGDDSMQGGLGNDLLDGGSGSDDLIGGGGDDIYVVDSYGDLPDERDEPGVHGGTDEVRTVLASYSLSNLPLIENLTGTSNGGQTLVGNGVANSIAAGAGDDELQGLGGNDVLNGGSGADMLAGGSGNDTATYADASAGVTVNLGTSVAQNTGGAGTDSLTSIENVTGSAYADTLSGTAGANVLSGLGGQDKLIAYDGNDVLDGGAGADVMRGGLGNDAYYVDDAHDKVVENSGEGTDTVYSSVNYKLSSSVEKLTLTGSAANGVGNALANHLVGTGSANVLNGGTGADMMSGGGGDDRYFVDNVGDSVVESSGGGIDEVNSTVSYALASNVEKLLLRGSSAINGTGNVLDNVLQGNAGANVLTGGGGDDKIVGGGGADKVIGGVGSDILSGSAGADKFVFDDGDFGGLTASTADDIRDFSHSQGDRIDLHRTDANSLTDGDQDFNFIGSADFHHVAGELRYEEINGNTYVYGDTNGDGIADMMIRLDGLHALVSADFGI